MAEVSSTIKSFQSLREAIDFISECIVIDSAITLFNQTIDAEKQAEEYAERPEHFAQWIFPALRKEFQKMDFRIRYKEAGFPADAEKFKLGGHDKELGHIHIDFIKRKNKWVIETIWQCR